MIYKLKLIFSHPMALAQAPTSARLQMAIIHAGLGLSFLLDPYKVLIASVLALFLLAIQGVKKTPYLAEHITFAQQRILLVWLGVGIFLVMFVNGQVGHPTWYIASKIALALCLYDAYLAYNGISGVFFVNAKKLRPQKR